MKKVPELIIILLFCVITAMKCDYMTSTITPNNSSNNNITGNYSTSTNYSVINGESDNSIDNHSSDNIQLSLWCPEHFQRNKMADTFMKACIPKSCIDVNENEYQNLTFLNEKSVTITKSSNSTSVRLCRSFGAKFIACSKTTLTENEYTILDNGTIWDKIHNSHLTLGNFFNDHGKLIVCENGRSNITSPSVVELPQPCGVFEADHEDFEVISSNQTLFVKNISKFITSKYFHLIDNETNALICDALDSNFLKCQYTFVERDDMCILPNRDLWTSFVKVITYSFGSYIIAEDESIAVVCVKALNIMYSRETPYIYGSVAILSAVCLFIALLVYLLIPKCNYHTRAMLCLAFSFFVTYVVLAIRSFVERKGFQSTASNLIIFSFQYIFALSSFFWLSVLAFELWRAFSRFHAYEITSGKSKKRNFIFKCIYAWGCPALLCAFILFLAFHPDNQKQLNIILMPASTAIWLLDLQSTFFLFYIPMLIILIINLLFFISTVINIQRAKNSTEMLRRPSNSSMKLFKVYVKLFVVMGLFWFAEIISWALLFKTGEKAWYVSDIINALQGVFIFIIYVCKKNVWLMIKPKLCCSKANQKIDATVSVKTKELKTSMTRSS